MSRPTVSIIVPVYNTAQYLRQCVMSVLSQTFSDWELILVDDGSSDGSDLICKEFADSYPSIIAILSGNNGVSAARNSGIQAATGDFITFLDSDDILDPDFLQVCIDIALQKLRNPEVNEIIVQTEWRPFKSSTANTGIQPLSGTERGMPPIREYSPVEAVESLLYQTGLCSSVWATLYSSSLFKGENPMLFTEKIRYEDLDIAWQLMLNADLSVLVKAPLYHYRIHPGSFLNRATSNRLDVLKVTDRIVKYMEKRDGEVRSRLLPAAHDRRLSAAFNMYCLLNIPHSIPETLSAPALRLCKEIISRYRSESLFNPKVRMKNKTGILLTYIGGFPLIRALAPLIYK